MEKQTKNDHRPPERRGKKYYFASDLHLDAQTVDGRAREKRLVRWLDDVSADARAVFLVGDVFDFWFEYRRVIPKGFSRLFGKLAQLTDHGVEVHFFTGNHDMWVRDYFRDELGVTVHTAPAEFELNGKRLFVAHGHNLEGRRGLPERLMWWAFHSRGLRWLFSRLVHPDAALRFGRWWSGKSRKTKDLAHAFRDENEPLVQFARRCERDRPQVDYFVFGHIHSAENYDLGDGRRAVFLGEWIECPGYAVLDEAGEIHLESLRNETTK